MQFLHPIYFLLIIFIAAVILFYFFRKQYSEQPVSSNFLWEQVLNEWQASPWLKKLQQNLLFWLQLIALLLLMMALVKPFWYENALRGDHLILIMDTSASMSADFGKSSRFAEAKKQSLELVEKLGGQEVTIIKTGDKPEILLSQETDPIEIRNRLKAIEISYGHEQIEKAMNLANSLSTGNDTTVHIFSDGVTKSQVNEHMKGQFVEVHNVGEMVDNLSLASFGVSPINSEIIGVAVIENQTVNEREVSFAVKSEDEVLFEQTLPVGGNEKYIVQIPALQEKPYYEAVILNEDGYLADNHATSILSMSKPKVYAIDQVNHFAVRGFEPIGVELLRTEAASLMQLELDGIIMTEGDSIASLPSQPLILFNNHTEKTTLTEPLTGTDDPLLQYVDYDKLYISSAAKPIQGMWETILSSGDTPLIQKGILNSKPIVVINFSLSDSDWPLQPGFPIFLYNVYEWLSQQNNFLGYFTPGEEKWLNVDEQNTKWEIFTQQNENLYSLDLSSMSFKAPLIPGTYQAVSGDKIFYFSVLLDDREKQAKIEPAFTMNEMQTEEKGQIRKPNEKIWFWLAFIALCLIAVEWEVYRRGHRV